MDQILIDSAKFPLLKENSLLSHYINLTKENEEAALSVVKNIQKDCPHPSTTETRDDKPLRSWEKGALITKQCTECGLVFNKPKASVYKVCIICWGQWRTLDTKGRGKTEYMCINVVFVDTRKSIHKTKAVRRISHGFFYFIDSTRLGLTKFTQMIR